jgi:hypothetical protein
MNKISKILLSGILCSTFLFSITTISFADLGDTDDNTPPVTNTGGTTNTLVNPINVSSLDGLVSKILGIAIIVAVPIAALLIIYAGFMYVLAQGDPKKVATAHQILLWTVVGIAIILGAWAMVQIIQGTVLDIANDSGTPTIIVQ